MPPAPKSLLQAGTKNSPPTGSPRRPLDRHLHTSSAQPGRNSKLPAFRRSYPLLLLSVQKQDLLDPRHRHTHTSHKLLSRKSRMMGEGELFLCAGSHPKVGPGSPSPHHPVAGCPPLPSLKKRFSFRRVSVTKDALTASLLLMAISRHFFSLSLTRY